MARRPATVANPTEQDDTNRTPADQPKVLEEIRKPQPQDEVVHESDSEERFWQGLVGGTGTSPELAPPGDPKAGDPRAIISITKFEFVLSIFCVAELAYL